MCRNNNKKKLNWEDHCKQILNCLGLDETVRFVQREVMLFKSLIFKRILSFIFMCTRHKSEVMGEQLFPRKGNNIKDPTTNKDYIYIQFHTIFMEFTVEKTMQVASVGLICVTCASHTTFLIKRVTSVSYTTCLTKRVTCVLHITCLTF